MRLGYEQVLVEWGSKSDPGLWLCYTSVDVLALTGHSALQSHDQCFLMHEIVEAVKVPEKEAAHLHLVGAVGSGHTVAAQGLEWAQTSEQPDHQPVFNTITIIKSVLQTV